MSAEEKDRLNKMARLVFNKGNLEQLREGLSVLIELFGDILEEPFEHGTCFAHDDAIERLEKIEQKKWRPIRNMFLLDPFYGYSQGNFSEDEKISPAKLMLDFLNVFDRINDNLSTKLESYKDIVNNLNKDKTSVEVALSKAEALVREERSLYGHEKTELKTARGTIAFLEGVVKEKNERIAELQREKNVQLWEREKDRIFAESQKKIDKLESDVVEQKRQNEVLLKRLTSVDENNKMLRMKTDLAKGTMPPTSKSSEELKRAIYLLEKDVIFLEQQIYNQQRVFATVLCGLKTDLVIIGDNLTDPDTGQIVDKDFVRILDITQKLYDAMLDGEIEEAQKGLPPHYSYLPNNFKVKRIKRVSRSRIKLPENSDCLPPIRQNTAESITGSSGNTVSNLDILGNNPDSEPIVENPSLIDSISKEVNTTQCMKHFPHMSTEFVKEHWIKFQEFDQDGNECLDFTEVVKALTAMGMQFTAEQAEEAMREADVNKSRTLDFYEYLLVADKLFSKRGRSELFHIGAAKNDRKVMAKTCAIQ